MDVAEHGTGLAESQREYFDIYGLLTWQMNPRGVITSFSYDLATSAVTQRVDDVDTAVAMGVPSGWSTQPGFGLNLITDYVNDALGRTLRVLRPWIQIDPATVGLGGSISVSVRPVSYTLYRDALHRRWNASGFLREEGPATLHEIIGPVSWTLLDADGRHVTDNIQTIPFSGRDPEDPNTFDNGGTLPARADWMRWTHHLLSSWGEILETRVYHSIPTSGDGTEGADYDATRFAYDVMNRLNRRVSPGGTITRSVFEARGLLTATWVGTDDTGATDSNPAGSDPPNNMKPVWLGEYDGGSPGGNGSLTLETKPVNDTTADDRVIQHAYDFRNRRVSSTSSDGTTDYIVTTSYDNRNLPLVQSRYHTGVATANRTHENSTAYDLRGRVYQRLRHYVNSNGTLGDALVAGTWYDPNGNVIKQTRQGAKAATKTLFDSLDRQITVYEVSEDASTLDDNTNDVSLDIVIQQTETHYNEASQVISSITQSRFDDATGDGPLQGPAGSEPKSRDTFTALYLDPAGRLRFSADYGTNGGSAWTRPDLHVAPSDTVLVSEQQYAADGDIGTRIDPQGTQTTEQRDAAGRRIELVENATGTTPDKRTSQLAYAPDGGLASLTLLNPTTGTQITTWSYGTTLATSGIARSDLPVQKTYPTSETEVQTYNRQGEISTFTDANGSVHAYDRDKLARLLHDRITSLAPDVDGLVRRLSTSYDQHGRIATLTSVDNATPGNGSIVNEVAYEYNGIDCLTSDAQSHAGAVNGSTPKVQYQCTAAVNGVLRRTGVVYPNGRALSYEYGTTGSIDDVLSRVQSVHDDDLTVLAEFQYVGLAMPSVTTLPEPEVQRRWKKLPSEPNGDGGDPYTGYDRFGRWIHMRWFKENTTPITLVDVKWGYNRASLKTWRQDVLATSLSAAQDQYFTYDGLYQVSDRQLGMLNGSFTGITGTPAQQEGFGYDETGNWVSYEQRNGGTLDIDQTRENNESNQITEIDSVSTGVAYDANGNMLKVPTGGAALDGEPRKLIWDAWNRLRKVTDDADNLLAEYQYDARTRRTLTSIDGIIRHYYYDDQWRSVEERLGNSVNAERQHTWHPTDRWELLLRDRSTANNGTLDERLYSMKDDLDPVAVCDASGVVVERYTYSAFGMTSFQQEDFTPQVGNQSGYAWNWLFHGEFSDELTGWFNYGYRYYLPETGRWLNRDPIGEQGGINLYGFVGNDPISKLDYLGLCDVYYLRDIGAIGHGWLEHPDGQGGKVSHHYRQPDGKPFGPSEYEKKGEMDKKNVSMFVQYTKSSDSKRKLGGGSKKGCPCSRASCEDIYECLENEFTCAEAEEYNVLTRNCRIVSVNAAKNCCLDGGESQPGAPK